MKVISVIEDQDVIKKILKHLRLWEVKPRPPPKTNGPTKIDQYSIDYSTSQLYDLIYDQGIDRAVPGINFLLLNEYANCGPKYVDCDGNAGNGCEFYLGVFQNALCTCPTAERCFSDAICGDKGCDTVECTGVGTKWCKLKVEECSDLDDYFHIRLRVPQELPSGYLTHSAPPKSCDTCH
jgi:hypothetical protein